MNSPRGQAEPQALPVGHLEAARDDDETDDQQPHADAARDAVKLRIVEPRRHHQPGRIAEDGDAGEPQRNQSR